MIRRSKMHNWWQHVPVFFIYGSTIIPHPHPLGSGVKLKSITLAVVFEPHIKVQVRASIRCQGSRSTWIWRTKSRGINTVLALAFIDFMRIHLAWLASRLVTLLMMHLDLVLVCTGLAWCFPRETEIPVYDASVTLLICPQFAVLSLWRCPRRWTLKRFRQFAYSRYIGTSKSCSVCPLFPSKLWNYVSSTVFSKL